MVVRSKLLKDMKIYLQTQLTTLKGNIQLIACIDRIGLVVDYKQKETIHCCWEKPKEGTIMINTDGSVNQQGAGFGGLIRNCLGEKLLGYIGSCTVSSVTYQELQAIAKGLVGADLLGLQEVTIASDTLGSINAIMKHEKPHWYCEDLVAEIQMRAHHFRSVGFKHIFRETNRAAIGGSEPCNFFMNPPDGDLYVILNEDRDGRLYTRF
ncbi:hypothetical protein FRX31_004312 [Thalictrum thalictroides]|uniref:RNase H type-1 domain-containing protein n=1 Tax=Thalictrum thalictroides TaxID=46969 RepID=A0A7J6X8P3_THATH|nr:hypothetical protein FRX31_004312 [Thalictrum thalictroides]